MRPDRRRPDLSSGVLGLLVAGTLAATAATAGCSAFQRGPEAGAADATERSPRLLDASTRPRFLLNAARDALATERYTHAQRYLEELLRSEPDHPVALELLERLAGEYEELARRAARRGETEDAWWGANRCMEIAPERRRCEELVAELAGRGPELSRLEGTWRFSEHMVREDEEDEESGCDSVGRLTLERAGSHLHASATLRRQCLARVEEERWQAEQAWVADDEITLVLVHDRGSCRYRGRASGAPPDRIEGEVRCLYSRSDDTTIWRGFWRATRGASSEEE